MDILNKIINATSPLRYNPSTSQVWHIKMLIKQHDYLHLQDCSPHKLSETVSGKLIFMIVVLIGFSTWLQFVTVTDLSGQMLTLDGVWHFGEVFSSRMNPGFHCTDGRQRVWADICYGQRTQVHFIDAIFNAQRYRDKILKPIVVLFIHNHHLMLQHDNARPHVVRICTQFLDAENIPVLAWPAYSPDMSPIEHVWDALDWRIRQRVPVSALSHWRGVDQHSTGHNQQPDQLYVKEMCFTARGKWWSSQVKSPLFI